MDSVLFQNWSFALYSDTSSLPVRTMPNELHIQALSPGQRVSAHPWDAYRKAVPASPGPPSPVGMGRAGEDSQRQPRATFWPTLRASRGVFSPWAWLFPYAPCPCGAGRGALAVPGCAQRPPSHQELVFDLGAPWWDTCFWGQQAFFLS